jgi:hypothetical protein
MARDIDELPLTIVAARNMTATWLDPDLSGLLPAKKQ